MRKCWQWPVGALCAWAAACAGASASSEASSAIWAAGGSRSAWIVLDGAAQAGDGKGGRLYHAPGDAPAGVVVPAQTWASPADGAAPAIVGVGGSGARVYLVFRRAGEASAEPASADGAGSRLQVRTVAVLGALAPGIYQFDPLNRLGVAPPLPEEAAAGRERIFVGEAAGSPVALLTAEAPGGAAPALLARCGDRWTPIDLPQEASRARRLEFVAGESGLTIIDLADAAPSRAWSGTVEFANEGADGTPRTARVEWREKRLGVSSAERWLVETSSGLIAGSRASNGDLELTLIRGEKRFPVRRVPGVPAEHSLAALGDDVLIGWLAKREDGREAIEVAVVSALTGRMLHRGAPVQLSPVRAQDVQFLGLLLGGVMLLVLVFVLRPPAASQQSIELPKGMALAEPSRRVFAGLLDLAPCILIASRVMGVGFVDVLALPFQQAGAEGMWPITIAFGLLWLHSAISECLWGRTVGKSIAGLWTASVTGTKPSLWQAVSRNAVKSLAPPVALVALLDPRRRHPGDLVAGTVVVSPVDEEEERADSEGN